MGFSPKILNLWREKPCLETVLVHRPSTRNSVPPPPVFSRRQSKPDRPLSPRHGRSPESSVSAPRSEGRNGARLAKPERTAGCLRHRPASLRGRGPGWVLGDSAGRRRRRLPVGGVTLPSASPLCSALQGPRGLRGCPFRSALFVSGLELQRSGRGL